MSGPFSKSAASLKTAFPLSLLLCLLLLCACGKPAPKAVPGVPVEARPARQADVPITISGIGRVTPVQSVTLRARQDGYVREVLVKDGQKVTAGQLLFRLDPRQADIAKRQAEASLEQARIQAQNARREAERAEGLLKDNMISAQDHDTLRSAAESLAAAVKVQEAKLADSALTVEFCTLRAPFAGRVGTVSVHAGDLAKANETAFVTLNQIAPIRVAFSVPENDLDAVRTAFAAHDVTVSARRQAERLSGKLVAIDNAVDPKTGSVLLTAEFANEAETLWPGQYVDAEAELGLRRGVVLVPSAAIQVGQNGAFVFVIDAGKTARLRRIVTGPIVGDEQIVASGLKAEELVVTDGQLRLGESTRIELRAAPHPASAK